MAYADLETECEICKEYIENDDYLLVKSSKIKSIKIPENYFCIVPNNFAHMALYNVGEGVKKVVIKIPNNMIN